MQWASQKLDDIISLGKLGEEPRKSRSLGIYLAIHLEIMRLKCGTDSEESLYKMGISEVLAQRLANFIAPSDLEIVLKALNLPLDQSRKMVAA